MKLAKIFEQEELVAFFLVSPVVDDNQEERDFFDTHTFIVERENVKLEFSCDSYTPNVTIQLFDSGHEIFTASLVAKSGRTLEEPFGRILSLETEQGISVTLAMPQLNLKFE